MGQIGLHHIFAILTFSGCVAETALLIVGYGSSMLSRFGMTLHRYLIIEKGIQLDQRQVMMFLVAVWTGLLAIVGFYIWFI